MTHQACVQIGNIRYAKLITTQTESFVLSTLAMNSASCVEIMLSMSYKTMDDHLDAANNPQERPQVNPRVKRLLEAL